MRPELEEFTHFSAVTNRHDDPFIPDAVDGKNFDGTAE
jgi:hypothetical protein